MVSRFFSVTNKKLSRSLFAYKEKFTFYKDNKVMLKGPILIKFGMLLAATDTYVAWYIGGLLSPHHFVGLSFYGMLFLYSSMKCKSVR